MKKYKEYSIAFCSFNNDILDRLVSLGIWFVVSYHNSGWIKVKYRATVTQRRFIGGHWWVGYR